MKKILLCMFLLIFLVGTVSSLDLDDVKFYDEETTTYTLENFFGLGKHIADLELKTPQIFKVPRGYQKVVEIEIRNGEYDYGEIINGIELYNIKDDMKEFARDVDYKYKVITQIPEYKTICDKDFLVNGTVVNINCRQEQVGLKDKIKWLDFTKNSLLKGENITLGIFTEVKKGDKVEWIINVYGNERLTKWASWEDYSEIGLIHYYKMDDVSSTTSIDSMMNNPITSLESTVVPGKIEDMKEFAGASDTQIGANNNTFAVQGVDWSFCGWVNTTSSGEYNTFVSMLNTLQLRITNTNKFQIIGAGVLATGTTSINTGGFFFVCITYDTDAPMIRLYVNSVGEANDTANIILASAVIDFAGLAGDEIWFGGLDDLRFFNRTLSTDEIEEGYIWGKYYVEYPTVILNFPIDTYNSTSSLITFNGTVYDNNTDIANVSLYIDGVLNETNSSGINNTDYIFTKTLSEGNHNWTYESCNNLSRCLNATVRTLGVDTIFPEVVILAPPIVIDHHLVNTNLFLNWSANDTNLDTCLYEYEGVNTTVTCSDNQTQINITNSINKSIIFYVNDTFGRINITSRSWNYTVFENSQTFNDETFEGTIETFTANVTIEESNPITVASLIYNGTSYANSFSQSGNDTILTINFTILEVNADTNITFYWSLLLSDSQIINLTSYNQTIVQISLDNCSTNTIVLYNYTVVDEGNQSILTPSNVTTELNLNLLGVGREKYIANFTKLYSGINPFAVCLNKNISSSIYLVDSIVKYESIGYSIEYYNIVDSTITNTTIPINITLYDLTLADATEFRISFKGEDFIFVENALIYIDRQYISENNSFKTVELPKTDSNGQTVGHFVRNDIIYNIRVIKDGEVLGNFENIIAFCTDFTIGDCQIVLEATPSALIPFDYDEQLGIIFQSLPTYNNNTHAVSFSFSTDDGTPKTVSMEVERKDIFGNRTICNSTLTSASGTLSCSVDPNIDDTVLETSIYVDNQLAVLGNVKLEASDYGNLGYVLWFFLTFLFIFIFGNSKTEVLIGLFISLAGAITLGITRGDIIGIGSAGIWTLVIVILGIWKINKENPQ